MHPKFIVDAHLGRLARGLRMLGLDALYENNWSKPQLLKLAVTENRVLLSRSAAFEKNPFLTALTIEAENPEAQLAQVVRHFGLQDSLQPFSRCMACNELLLPVSKETVADRLEPNTRAYFEEFWQCPRCRRIYWKGSHYSRMTQFINGLKGK